MRRKRLPPYAYIGALIIAMAEILLLTGNSIVRTYFTPLVWTGYIIFVDALVAARKGESALTKRRREFFIA